MNEYTQKKPHKGFYILPNLFTTGSLFTAFIAITYCFKGDFYTASMLVFLSAFFDGLDGKVARLTNTTSQFGIEYDSLADVVAFGVTPSIIAWSWQLHAFGKTGIVIAFLYVACAALRLARFNVDVGTVSKKFFIGLPSPAAGALLPAFVLFTKFMPEFMETYTGNIALVICLVAPLLMVSRVRYYSFKEFGYAKKYPFRVLVMAILFMLIIFSKPSFWLFIVGSIYITAGIVYTYVYIPYRNTKMARTIKSIADQVVE